MRSNPAHPCPETAQRSDGGCHILAALAGRGPRWNFGLHSGLRGSGTNWLGTSIPLQDRAVNILEVLLSEPGLKSGPVVFICHSLGGLIVKQILLDLQQQKDRRKEANDLLNRVTQIVFAATPHTGARQATWLDRLRFFAWPSSNARALVANDPTLRSINVAYRGFADERGDLLQHRVFYETQ